MALILPYPPDTDNAPSAVVRRTPDRYGRALPYGAATAGIVGASDRTRGGSALSRAVPGCANRPAHSTTTRGV
ncbi:hypothetical protein MHK71_04815 [Kocuria indica]|uniref:hypothetical protein n=1 Tax=Kocuria marina TaxID=223184 RepID=UPI001EF5D933|nr:hypothetical protein [Kocuria indica]MCG7431837.1 hypothetical protein [Kocuria indica]